MESLNDFIKLEYDGGGYGYGSGGGYGGGYGDGYGDGYSGGYGIKSINGKAVYLIDDTETIIEKIKGDVAKGYILNSDLNLTPCYVAKGQNKFAHGYTLREAVSNLQDKIHETIDTDEAIKMFKKEFTDLNKKYPAMVFFKWHNILTNSCRPGREAFAKSKGIDLENDTFTVREFIELTENAYGGHIIKKLKERKMIIDIINSFKEDLK